MAKHVVCCNCIDGRVQIPVINWIKTNYQVDYVDMVTEPGMNGLLAQGAPNDAAVKRKISISIQANGSDMIFVVGHFDCKGNPVEPSMHQQQVKKAVESIKGAFSEFPVVGLWVDAAWQVNQL